MDINKFLEENKAEVYIVEDDGLDFFRKAEKQYAIQVSTEILDDTDYIGEVYGYGCEETGHYYVLSKENNSRYSVKGLIIDSSDKDIFADFDDYCFFACYIDDTWFFCRCNEEKSYMSLLPFGMVNKLFSRNKGLFETDEMLKKRAIIVGAGSVGSEVALQLARSGVGEFLLIDGDILEIHNVIRHQLGFRDLGRYKVDALKEAILNINPFSKVEVFKGYLENIEMEMIKSDTNAIIIGTADNRAGNALANDLAKLINTAFVAIGCWTRCHAGEVFYWSADDEGLTYSEAFKELISDERPVSHQNYFADISEQESLNFEPGTAIDLSFVTEIGLKICLDLINRDSENYSLRVLDYLKNYTLICNTNKKEIGGETAEIFPHPLFISSTISFKDENA